MKKLTEFIEKHVQWLVLGLGVCYLLYMAWAYLVFPPVKVTGIGPDPLSPGDIDQHIYNDIAAPLEGKMKEGKPPKISWNAPKSLMADNTHGSAAERYRRNHRQKFGS